jgi:hypothetical protein
LERPKKGDETRCAKDPEGRSGNEPRGRRMVMIGMIGWLIGVLMKQVERLHLVSWAHGTQGE